MEAIRNWRRTGWEAVVLATTLAASSAVAQPGAVGSCPVDAPTRTIAGATAGLTDMSEVHKAMGSTKGRGHPEWIGASFCYRTTLAGGRPAYLVLGTGLTGRGTTVERVSIWRALPREVTADDCRASVPAAVGLGWAAALIDQPRNVADRRFPEARAEGHVAAAVRGTWMRPAPAGGPRASPSSGPEVHGDCGVRYTVELGRVVGIEVWWREAT